MSTRIYNAFRFHGGVANIEELLKFCKSFRKDILNAQQDVLWEAVRRAWDQNLNQGQNKTIGNVVQDVVDQAKKATTSGLACEPLDVENNAVIYINDDIVVIQFFLALHQPSIRELFNNSVENNHAVFTDYHYQNQSDRYFDFEEHGEQELVALEKDWAQRERFYDAVFGDNWVPTSAGLSYDFCSVRDLDRMYFEQFGRPKEIASMENM